MSAQAGRIRHGRRAAGLLIASYAPSAKHGGFRLAILPFGAHAARSGGSITIRRRRWRDGDSCRMWQGTLRDVPRLTNEATMRQSRRWRPRGRAASRRRFGEEEGEASMFQSLREAPLVIPVHFRHIQAFPKALASRISNDRNNGQFAEDERAWQQDPGRRHARPPPTA